MKHKNCQFEKKKQQKNKKQKITKKKPKKQKNQIYADNSTMHSVGHTAYHEDLEFF